MIEKRFRKKQSISKAERQRLIESIKTYFSKQNNVIFTYIHGSFAEEEHFSLKVSAEGTGSILISEISLLKQLNEDSYRFGPDF